MTILVLSVPVYAQSEKRIDTKEKQENAKKAKKKNVMNLQDIIKNFHQWIMWK